MHEDRPWLRFYGKVPPTLAYPDVTLYGRGGFDTCGVGIRSHLAGSRWNKYCVFEQPHPDLNITAINTDSK